MFATYTAFEGGEGNMSRAEGFEAVQLGTAGSSDALQSNILFSQLRRTLITSTGFAGSDESNAVRVFSVTLVSADIYITGITSV